MYVSCATGVHFKLLTIECKFFSLNVCKMLVYSWIKFLFVSQDNVSDSQDLFRNCCHYYCFLISSRYFVRSENKRLKLVTWRFSYHVLNMHNKNYTICAHTTRTLLYRHSDMLLKRAELISVSIIFYCSHSFLLAHTMCKVCMQLKWEITKKF